VNLCIPFVQFFVLVKADPQGLTEGGFYG
jgi:hypothetical protein